MNRFITPETKTLVWTLTSHGYQFHTWNLIECLRKLNVPWKLCVVCADEPSYKFMRLQGIPAMLSSRNLPDFGIDISPFGSTNFKKLNQLKLHMLNEFANNPDIQHCIYMDGDIAVYKDFVPDILERLQQDNLLFQCDEKDRNLVCESSVCPNVCTGFIAWNHGHDGGVFKLNDKDLWLKYPEDQLWVNNKLGLNSVPFRTLPRSLYPNGTFVSLIAPKKDSYILHYNYRVGKNKKTDMKIFGDWHIII